MNPNQSEVERSILVGGSKSQKRVGRNLLRALEAYNSQHFRMKNKQGTDDQLPVAEMKLSSDMPNAEMNGDDHNIAMNVEVANHSTHKNKKSRRASPRHEELQINPAKQDEPNAAGSVPDKQSLSIIEKSEQELLQQLALVTYQAITERVVKLVDADNLPKWAWWNENGSTVTPKWCMFKLSSANTRQTLTEQDQASAAQDTSLMASTVACAAASGRSRGLIDKSELAAVVVDALKAKITEVQNKQSQLEFRKIQCHEKSGQVQVIFQVPPKYLAGISQQSPKSGNQTVKRELPAVPRVPGEEPLTEFFSRYYSQEYPRQSSHLKKSCTSQLESTQHKKLHLVVRTVPVYESSLQPEVHRLFCTYQTATHGDANPFLCTETHTNQADSDVEYSYFLDQNPIGFLDVDSAYSHVVSWQHSHNQLIIMHFL